MDCTLGIFFVKHTFCDISACRMRVDLMTGKRYHTYCTQRGDLPK